MQRDELARHKYVIFGAARSGIAAAKLLKRQGLEAVVADQKAACAAAAAIEELDGFGIRSYWGERAIQSLEGNDVMILSPGIPDSSDVVREARKRGMHIISEIELASLFVSPEARLVAITGTNGKTTTTSWIAHLLKASGFNSVLAGNIGDAWSNSADAPGNQNSNTVFVVEVSSFQLEKIETFHPLVALLTNLAPDHLDRYAGYSDYVNAKKNILKNMMAPDAFIWNVDNTDSADFFKGTGARVLCFTKKNFAEGSGAFVKDGMIVLRDMDSEVSCIPVSELPLPGDHNVENALGASLAAHLAGATPEGIREGLRTFGGVEHRIELCGEKNGVRFYNDSKATNVDSLEKALSSFKEPMILIAGGRDKNSDYSVLNDLVRKHVKKLVTIGEAAPLMEKAWGNIVEYERAESMLEAVRKGYAAAEKGDVVILSPACASFDWYKDYEQRGRDFKDRVKAVLAES